MAAIETATASVPGRYASALFDLAQEQKAVAEVEEQLVGLKALIDESADLRHLIQSPVFRTEDQARAVAAVLAKAGVEGITANFIGLVAKNRRLFVLPDIIKVFRDLAAAGRDEVTAEVVTAEALSEEQVEALKETLAKSVGKAVVIDQKVDPQILGGLIVKIGSRMVDSSLRTRLTALEVGLKRSA